MCARRWEGGIGASPSRHGGGGGVGDCGRELENPEETHTGSVRTCKLNLERLQAQESSPFFIKHICTPSYLSQYF